jgi:hypothetical protein
VIHAHRQSCFSRLGVGLARDTIAGVFDAFG